MSADAASLPCPICYHTGVFNSVHSLRDRLIYVSTNKLLCPVCQEEVFGLDKLTIHLFTHVKIIATKGCMEKSETKSIKNKEKTENQIKPASQKKSRSTVAKNRPPLPTVSSPVKYIKIYPKLPLLSPLPIIDISQKRQEERVSDANSIPVLDIKPETKLIQSNTTCTMCGLRFIDADILRMHKCIIHNIDENSNQNITRHHCHLCLKNFKMRGSLMVHLRVAHYGFSLVSETTDDKSTNGQNHLHPSDEKTLNIERNDNKQWQCDVCRKCFTTKYFLKKHKRLHTGETPYACSQCNKTFTFQQSYHKHLLYHNDEKPHCCSYCGRAFKELSTLHNHQRIHTGEKPFSCETCGKCFRQRVSYLVHRRIHTGVMPYKCTSCDKSFRYKVSQRTHKCLAQPPGTVIRRAGELVEKLKKKHAESCPTYETASYLQKHVNYAEVSEANAELVRSGAKLSLEDMESDNFSLIAEVFNDSCYNSTLENSITEKVNTGGNTTEVDKNIPSPTEILKKLCLSKEEDYSNIFHEENDEKDYDICKELNTFL